MKILSRLEDVAMGLMLWVLFLVVGLQFFTRYMLNDSIGWTEEVARMLLILLTYLGAIVCARKGEHIQVDLIMGLFGYKFRNFVLRFYDFICMFFFMFLAYDAANFAMTTRLKMSSIPIPKSYIFWICALSLALMAIHYFISGISKRDHAENNSTRLT